MDIPGLLNPQEVVTPLSRIFHIDSLLNPAPSDTVDVLPLIKKLSTFSKNTNVLVPQGIKNHLSAVLAYLETNSLATNPPVPHAPPDHSHDTAARTEETDIKINRETTLDILYRYPLNTVIEYPETSATGTIGHLFAMDPDNWENPALSIAYSRGHPGGQTVAGKEVKIKLLVSSETGQGSKVCPYSDKELLSLPHTSASREDVKERLQNDRDDRLQTSSPSKDVFHRTVGYLAAVQKLGCSRPISEQTFLSATEEEERYARELYLFQAQRGYRMKDGICEGRIVFDYDDNECPISSGAYDIDYIEAVITGDEQEASRIEDSARDLGYGPRVECTTVWNFSKQKANCPIPHRDENGALIQPFLERLLCNKQRRFCPFILIVTSGDHPHPVPLPTKTPPQVRSILMSLFEQLGEDLPDLTARKFIRHPILKSFLQKRFPDVISPTLADWHVSLANRAHLKAYIKQAREQHYPFGTGWAGVINLKEYQDSRLPKDAHYIRRVLAINIEPEQRQAREEDEDDDITRPEKDDNRLRIIICMTPEASRRLRSSGRYLQSDIGFKRIVGFKEFEVAGMDRDANTSIIYVRIFLNRMSALAHQRVFEEIEAIVLEDTGHHLQWHHLHASGPEDGLGDMILSWVADQHRGQAKGLGLHLQKLASHMQPKPDLYEQDRLIQDLSPYDHLHRNYRVCTVHYSRLVKLCAGPMAYAWSRLHGAFKLAGGFVFEGICWERSFMPRSFWEAGDSNSNLIESVHRDANREGVHCTLLGGLQKGQQFDAMKMKTLRAHEHFGITPSYKTGHLSENAYFNLKRRDNQNYRLLAAEDAKIEALNQKLQSALDKLVKAQRAVAAKERQHDAEVDPERRQRLGVDLEKKVALEAKAFNALEKISGQSLGLERTGSGRVSITRPMLST
ncbi:hypothetical protein DFH09DRAFT_1281487 [Mycena vulgaris]|nr:hypothetical protein DFH09DRAFT_1281487 [Mycena vulgaris]